jgi:hypothetical protein
LSRFIVRQADGYLAQILPEIAYDRAAIGSREARIRLTQEILRAFEPVIRQHPRNGFTSSRSGRMKNRNENAPPTPFRARNLFRAAKRPRR